MGQALSLAKDGPSAVPILVIGAENGWRAAQQAVEAMGGGLTATLDWGGVAQALDDHTGCSVILVEAEGTDVDTLAVHLPRIDAFAAAINIPVVIALGEASIDVVFAAMVSAHVQMLCAPTITDRTLALAIATGQQGVMPTHDVVREGEAARLQRLTDEVARVAELLVRLSRAGVDEPRAAPIGSDRPTSFRPEPQPDIVIDAAEIRRAIRARRLRDQHFGGGLFEDPAWDILLDLFAAGLEGSKVSVSSLCIAASVAPTTALRWIAKLTDLGLLTRHPDPLDRRRAYVELSSGASRSMRDYVAGLRNAGLSFG